MATGLLDLLGPVLDRLKAVNPVTDADSFSGQLLKLRREAFTGLPGGADGARAGAAARAIARVALRQIAKTPALVEMIAHQVNDPSTPPAMKLTHVLCLSYLVAVRDLLPDDLPAAYGFVDDTVLLWAALGAREHVVTHDGAKVKQAGAVIRMLSMAVPRDVAAKLVPEMAENQTLMQVASTLPKGVVIQMTKQVLAAPHAPLRTPPAPDGFVPEPPLFALPGGKAVAGGGGLSYQFDDGGSVELA